MSRFEFTAKNREAAEFPTAIFCKTTMMLAGETTQGESNDEVIVSIKYFIGRIILFEMCLYAFITALHHAELCQ